jgi:hypothetical protein
MKNFDIFWKSLGNPSFPAAVQKDTRDDVSKQYYFTSEVEGLIVSLLLSFLFSCFSSVFS